MNTIQQCSYSCITPLDLECTVFVCQPRRPHLHIDILSQCRQSDNKKAY